MTSALDQKGLEAVPPAPKVTEERTWGEIPNARTDDAHPVNVLAGVLLCAESWMPEARIIGNVRAGDIARAIRAFEPSALAALTHPTEQAVTDAETVVARLHATAPAPNGWTRVTEDDGSEYLDPPDNWLKVELATPPAPKVTDGEWRYEIKYGPEGEANYAFVYDEGGHLVSNLKVHHAIAVVTAMNATLTAAQEAAPKVTEWCEITEDDQPPRDVPVLMGCWEKWPRDEWVVEFGLYGSTKGGWIHGRMTHWLPSSFLPSAPILTAAQEAGKL